MRDRCLDGIGPLQPLRRRDACAGFQSRVQRPAKPGLDVDVQLGAQGQGQLADQAGDRGHDDGDQRLGQCRAEDVSDGLQHDGFPFSAPEAKARERLRHRRGTGANPGAKVEGI